MARIRTIKPEFPQSESVGKLSRDARLLFLQLFTVADDAGRARASSRLLASLLYPYDDDAPGQIDDWLGELVAAGRVTRYEVDGAHYLAIANWLEHQKIDHASASRLPAPPDAVETPREPSRKLAPDLGPRIMEGIKDQDSPAVAKATRREVEEWFESFWLEYPEREGANPRAPALAKFLVAITVDKRPDKAAAEAIIAGAKRYNAEVLKIGKARTSYVAQAVTWLNQKRWQDYGEAKATAATPGVFIASADSEELRAWDTHRLSTENKPFPRDKAGGWTFPTRWPPGHVGGPIEPPSPQ